MSSLELVLLLTRLVLLWDLLEADLLESWRIEDDLVFDDSCNSEDDLV